MDDANSAASDWGMPGLRMLSVPSEKWYTLRRTLEEIRPVADETIDTIIDDLTRPLTPDEANPPREKKEDIGPSEFVVTADSYPSSLEKFNELFLEDRMGDGLPLIPPTEERVRWMLSGTNRSPETAWAMAYPLYLPQKNASGGCFQVQIALPTRCWASAP